MPRIAVVGNCQALGVAEVLKYLLPNSFIKQSISWEIQNWISSYEDFVRDLATFDHVFVQDVAFGNFPGANLERLRQDLPNVVEFPIIVFPAFHPDLVYVSNKKKENSNFILSPIGPYNSAIALYAYKRDYTVIETLNLFKENVYKRLGYFDFWDSSTDALLANGKRLGFDLTENLARWSREGCFMHSINHAKLIVLADIAQLLLDKVGIRARQNNWKDYVVDPAQMDAIWPVYTEVASKFAFNGSYIFKKPNYALKENTQFFTLDTFVSKSFESYKHFPKTDLLCERVDQWLADESLAAFLDRAAM
ncbi:WcbI family polysaccharide biosynthesis putative acetyltransferase [Labrys portucalensis]|uniref:WcbI family polysaccharide biosynthesis putative acetyltransferase n=1 Tax=Labrys neptuniae TaxID=376174 RepID=A0ABV6ZPK0_9HYPH